MHIENDGLTAKSKLQVDFREISLTGSKYYHSVSTPDYNPDELVGRKGLEIYKKMRDDDQVKAVLTMKKFARLMTPWEVQPASQDAMDVEIAEFVKVNFQNLEGTFEDNLLNILTALDFGFSLTEKLWYRIEKGEFVGKIGIKSLKTREPFYYQFESDNFGNLRKDGIIYCGPGSYENEVKGNDENVIQSLNNNIYGRRLPIDKFIIYSYNREFSNHYGRSDLRGAYRSWWSKELLIRFMNMYMERFGMPTHVAKVPKSMSKPDKEKLQIVLDRVQSKYSIVIPEDVAIELLNAGTGGEGSFRDSIEMHNKFISRSILVPDLMGFNTMSGGGSYALGKKHFDVFLWILQKLGRDLEETVIGEQIIKQLVDYNYSNVEDYPKFKFESITAEGTATRANIIQMGVAGGFINPEEEWIREYLALPKADPSKPLGMPKEQLPGGLGMVPEKIEPEEGIKDSEDINQDELLSEEEPKEFRLSSEYLEACKLFRAKKSKKYDFDESLHPRDEDGKFEDKAGDFGGGNRNNVDITQNKKEFNTLIKQLPKQKLMGGDVVGDTYGIGKEGGDLTFKAKSTFKEMGYILDETPDLINDVPIEEQELFVEFLKQNNRPVYNKIIKKKKFTKEIQTFSITKIKPNPEQNKIIDGNKVQSMVTTLQRGEELSPIEVDKDYNLINGHHRLMAYKMLGKKEIPVEVVDRFAEDSDIERWVTINGRKVPIVDGKPQFGGKEQGKREEINAKSWFHTTRIENIEKIQKEGFKSSSNSIFGSGVYFSGTGGAHQGGKDIKVKVDVKNPLIVDYIEFPDKYNEITGKKSYGLPGEEKELVNRGYDSVYIKDNDWLVVYDKSKISIEKHNKFQKEDKLPQDDRFDYKIDFKQMEEDLDEYETDTVDSLSKIIKEQKDALLKSIEKKKIVEDKDYTAVDNLQLKFVGDFKKDIEQRLIKLYLDSKLEMIRELAKGSEGQIQVVTKFADVTIQNWIPVSPTEAIDFFNRKVLAKVITSEGIKKLITMATRKELEYYDSKAFAIAGVERDAILKKAKFILLDGLKTGASNKDVMFNLGNMFDEYLVTGELKDEELVTPARLETIVRTNFSEALNAGRKAMFDNPILEDFVPYVQWKAILDSRVRPSHAEMHNKIFKRDDPSIANLPPAGFNCRCLFSGITKIEVQKLIKNGEGIEVSTIDDFPADFPDKGFNTYIDKLSEVKIKDIINE